jgi:AAA domain
MKGPFLKPSPAVRVIRGRQTVAQYRDHEIERYRGNPFIEALPPILTEDQAMDSLARYQKFDEKERLLPAHLRLHLVLNVSECFVPLPVHLDLEQRFSRMIRAGYTARNPVAYGFPRSINARCATLPASLAVVSNSAHPLPLGFTIIGFPGVGKSTSVETVLSLYPQVIYHSSYADRDFNVAQLVWLKLECPFDGSPRGLCLNFLNALDQILGTNYEYNYAGSRRTSDDMIPKLARLTALHGLGVLVIDEINRLTGIKGAGMKLLSFFVQLTNSMGMPIVLVGTYKAKQVLAGEFHQVRRGTGQGDLVWDRMEESDWIDTQSENGTQPQIGVWQLLLEELWTYQYTRVRCPLTKELSHVLYEETQGITDFAAKVYMLAQIRAIVTARTPDEEVITPDIIRSVARDSLKQAQPVLAALRRGTMEDLLDVPDVHPVVDRFIQQAQSQLRQRPLARVSQTPTPPVTPYGETKPRSQKLKNKSKDPNKTKTEQQFDAGDLRAAGARAASSTGTIYETLREADQVGDAIEYLDEKGGDR